VISRGVSRTRLAVGTAQRSAREALVRRRTPKLAATDAVAVVRGWPLVLPEADLSPVAKRLVAQGEAEPAFTAMVERVVASGQIVVDVGAGVGYYTCLMARAVGERGRVIAFEPWPTKVRYLRHNVALNALERVTIVPAAAFDRSGQAHLEAPGNRLTMGGHRPPGAVDVRAERLDDFAEVRLLRRLDTIRLDVGGAELRALRGMMATLNRWQPMVLLAVQPTLLRTYDDSLDDLYRFLGDLDYGYAPVEGPLTGDEGFHLAAAPVTRLYSHGLVPFS
jgi:FkbM family methyltransferase